MDTWDRQRALDNSPYFFLSYAHTPSWGPAASDPDHWVHVLYMDLLDHIMHLTDLPAGVRAGFMDREMRSGDGWPEKLSENLAACRVFVPLYSPRYFASEMCGREWYAFNERMVHARAAGGGNVSAIVPILWTGVDFQHFPDSVRHIHIEHFGGRYADEGIYGLIKLNRLRDEYQETVLRLAQLIVRVAQESPLPPGRPRPYETTPSAFRPRGTAARHIHVTIAAPTRDAVPEWRDERPYGEDARDWNPYHSESTRPLPALAEELIRSLDYRVTVSSFDDEEGGQDLGPPQTAGPGGGTERPGGPERPAGSEGPERPVRPGGPAAAAGPAGTADAGYTGYAGYTPDAYPPDAAYAPDTGGAPDTGEAPAHQPGILIVDRWALADSDRRRRLKAFDATSRPWVGAVVPWNRADLQCHGEEGRRLTEELERTLPNILDRGRRTDTRLAVNGVPTLKAFTDILPSVVANTTRQYLKYAAAHPPDGRKTPRPRLMGPLPPHDDPGPELGGDHDDGHP